jgi:hypothetical protein
MLVLVVFGQLLDRFDAGVKLGSNGRAALTGGHATAPGARAGGWADRAGDGREGGGVVRRATYNGQEGIEPPTRGFSGR